MISGSLMACADVIQSFWTRKASDSVLASAASSICICFDSVNGVEEERRNICWSIVRVRGGVSERLSFIIEYLYDFLNRARHQQGLASIAVL